jgi:hypothetical protein
MEDQEEDIITSQGLYQALTGLLAVLITVANLQTENQETVAGMGEIGGYPAITQPILVMEVLLEEQ